METDTAKLSTVELIIEVIKYKCDKNQSSITCALLKKMNLLTNSIFYIKITSVKGQRNDLVRFN